MTTITDAIDNKILPATLATGRRKRLGRALAVVVAAGEAAAVQAKPGFDATPEEIAHIRALRSLEEDERAFLFRLTMARYNKIPKKRPALRLVTAGGVQ